MERQGQCRGFTLVELLVALAVGSIILALVYQMFIAQRRGYSEQQQVAEMQQNARIAADELARALKNIGNGIDRDQGQDQLLYCGPYEIVFNTDGDDDRGATTGPITPGSGVSSLFGAGTLHTAPATVFAGGAETHQIALKADGTRHYNLVRRVFAGGTVSGPTEIALDLNNKNTANAATPLFLYFGDFDGDGTTDPWPNPGTEVSDLSGQNRPLDRMVRLVQIQVVAETKDSDRAYSTNSGYRQTVVQSNVTPRNLWICPSIQANTTAVTVTTTQVNGGTTTYTFHVVAQGRPERNRTVRFALTDTVGTAALAATSGTTNNAGDVTATVNWSQCPALKTAIEGAPGRSIGFTLTATIGEPPSLSTPMGVCAPDSAATQITLVPGDQENLILGPATPPTIYTCVDPRSFAFNAKTTDVCDIDVPPVGVSFNPVDRNGQPFPQYEVTPAFSQSPQDLTVQLRAGAAGPFTAFQDPTDGSFPLMVAPVGWTKAPPASLPTAAVKPWDPRSLGSLTNSIASLVNHTDCPSDPVPDTFQVFDCFQNAIYQLGNPGGFFVKPSLTAAVGGPADQGMLYSIQNGGKPAWPDVRITLGQGGGKYEFMYEPPKCTLGPPPGRVIKPSFELRLFSDANPNPPGVPGVAPLGPQLLNLQSCADCSLSANPPTINQCRGETTITVSGCDLSKVQQKSLEIEVTSTGQDGSFDLTAIVTNLTIDLSHVPPGPWTQTTKLYLGNARNGDVLTVIAYYPSKAQALWRCGPLQIPVSSLCESLEVYNDSGYTEIVGSQPGQQRCLARIKELYFEVEDCQNKAGTLKKAVAAEIWSYTVGQGNQILWYQDREYVDLQEYPLNSSPPLKFRSQTGLPVQGKETADWNDGILTYPEGRAAWLWVYYADPNDPGDVYWLRPSDRCSKWVPLTVPLPICFPNAITSAGGATWNGNFDCHWGDVVIMGNTTTPQLAKYIEKSSTGMFNGSSYGGAARSDRFFDIYVGKSSPGDPTTGNFIGELNPNPNLIDRPFIASGYGNYFRNVPHDQILKMITFLDYDTMKSLAKDRGVYWYTLPSGDIRNPWTGQVASFQTVLSMTGLHQYNAYHDGLYIFVDTYGNADPGPNTTGADVDAAPLGSLPRFTVSGNFYTEGILYVAGSIDFTGLGPTTTIVSTDVETPPQYEMHYDHNSAAWDPNAPGAIPVRPNPKEQPDTFALNVHIFGAIYVDGEFAGNGNPSIFGAITTERGYSGSGTPEIWYNYRLNQSGENDTLCINCCNLEIQPQAASIYPGQTTTLTGLGAGGNVIWSVISGSDVVSIDPNGVVTALKMGSARIRATDANNCGDYATIEVGDPCQSFAITPAATTIAVGQQQTFQAVAPPSANVGWQSDDTTVATVAPASGLSTVATGQGGGQTVVIRASDGSNQCPPAEALLTVDCALSVTPASANGTVGVPIVLTAVGAGSSAISWVTDAQGTLNPATGASTTYTPQVPGNHTVTATNGQCTTSVPIAVALAPCTLVVSPSSAAIITGGSIGIAASNASGSVSWTSSSPIATVSPSSGFNTTVTGVAVGTATITGTDSACSRSSIITVVDCAGLAITGAPANLEIGKTVALSLDPATGPVTWSSSPAGLVSLTPRGVYDAQVDATGQGTGAVTITAQSSGCSTSVTFRVIEPLCRLSVSPLGPVDLKKGTSVTLNALGANGTVTWSSSKAAWVSVFPATGLTTAATAESKNQTAIITAMDSVPAGCTAQVTILTQEP